ncbi:MAG: TIGR03619 family F420-dependent LLM class oxidoreductase [Acidimicrobiales bacterium]|nr:TIGR03619 family F420-dependent LLM class oxidoreductase [Acidimicrobiales bacterium]
MELGGGLNLSWLSDVPRLREAVIALEDAGFDYVTVPGHVLSTAPGRYPERPPTTYGVPFIDPFVLFTHLCSVTERLRFRTAIMILPLYPTGLVARQAADLAAVSGGRFELGVGISWQEAEYRALGQDLHQRGRRLEEQLMLLRRLWSEPLVTFQGRYHDFDQMGLGQVPPAPVPIWIGCAPTQRLLHRVARLGDGWMPVAGIPSADSVVQLRQLASKEGRDPSSIGVAGRITAGARPGEEEAESARSQVAMGATGLTIGTAHDAPLGDGVAAMIAARGPVAAAVS